MEDCMKKGLLTLTKNEHAGHRQRLKQRFLNEGGFENFEDHQILEMLLFYAIPQKDTNPIAHRLLDRFGTLYAVFDAPIEELIEIEGISHNSALFIKTLLPFFEAYQRDKYKKISVFLDSTNSALEFFKEKYKGFTEETFSVVCLDNKCRVISFDIIAKGSINKVLTDNRETLRRLIQNKSVCAMVCHNHPGGVPVPSESDKETTKILVALMRSFGVRMLDHIIVGGQGDAFSMKDSAFYRDIFYKYS